MPLKLKSNNKPQIMNFTFELSFVVVARKGLEYTAENRFKKKLNMSTTDGNNWPKWKWKSIPDCVCCVKTGVASPRKTVSHTQQSAFYDAAGLFSVIQTVVYEFNM